MKEYLERYRSRMILLGAFVFLIHGAKLHSGIIGIDTEDIIHIQGDFYGGWLNTGRQGLYALKGLMDSLAFKPYMAGLMTIVLFAVAVNAFFLLWDKALAQQKNGKVLPWMAGGLFIIAHPILTEQFYFTLQSVEICIGFCLTAVSLYLILGYGEGKELWKLLTASVILILNFSIYQAFVVVFIFGTVSVLLADGISKFQRGHEITAQKLLKGLLPYLLVFLVAFFINTWITKCFFGSSDYLGGQILWGKFDIMDNFRAIAGHVLNVLSGSGQVYYHFSFGLLSLVVICLVMFVCILFVKEKGQRSAVFVLLFYLAALFATPFLMTVVCGGAPVIRSQLVLPFLTGFLAYLAVTLLSGYVKLQTCMGKLAVAVLSLICVIGIWWQTSLSMSLYYTDELRYAQDEYLGRELITEIDKVREGANLPVAIVGTKPFSPNNACVMGEMIGKSFFDHDADVEPEYYWSTRRMLGFLHVLGADYNQAHAYRFGDVVNYSMGMPSWPAEGCVAVYDGMIVVKLSDD